MKAMFITDRINRTCAIIAFAALAESIVAAPITDFQKLLAAPALFDGKRVTLIGVASIGGAEFYLYPTAREARKAGAAVFINRNLEGPRLDKFSNHWLKVTGVVNARRHGPFNFDSCEIWLEHFDVLPKPPLPNRNIYGVFKNDTPNLVKITVYRPDGYATWEIQAGATSTEGIEQGSTAKATTSSGKLIAKSDLIPSKALSQYFDSVHRSYYYRITTNKIEFVPPGETKGWNVYRP